MLTQSFCFGKRIKQLKEAGVEVISGILLMKENSKPKIFRKVSA
jgi:hypothetical protein